MVIVETSRVIAAPREKVFKLWTDFENGPKNLPTHFKSVKILQREGNTVTTDEVIMAAGRTVKQTSRHTIQGPDKHEVEVLTGDAVGTTVSETFTEVPEGTKVSVVGDVRLAGILKMIEVLGKGRIRAEIEDSINQLAKIAESS